MNEIVQDIYIIMLSPHYNSDFDNRVSDAKWLLITLGVPMKGTVVVDGR
jgi:hypothetical protein